MKVSQIGSNQTQVEFCNGTRVLISYSTPVAAYVPGRGYVRTEVKFSATTNRHISQFVRGDVATVSQAEMVRIANNGDSSANPPVRFKVTGRRWFSKTHGNTYHSVEVRDMSGNLLYRCPFAYGYGDQYLGTAGDWLVSQGLVDAPEGSTQSTIWAREIAGIDYQVFDVDRKRDL